MKKCSVCLATKPPMDFHKQKRAKDGLFPYCKICNSAQARAAYALNPSRRLSLTRAWRAANPDKTKNLARVNRLRTYGITLEVYEEMLAAQNNCCAICGNTPNGRTLSVDHDHETKKPRGLLCLTCNTAIGYLQDSPDILRQAALYLDSHEGAA